MAKTTLIEAINAALFQEMERDPSVVVLGEDVGFEGGVFRATAGLQQKFGEARAIDTPLAEAGIVGTAIGMAAFGLRPVAEMQFSGFDYVALNQLINHAARIRNRSRGQLQCPLVLRAPYGGGIRALEHHSESLEAIYVHAQGFKVVIPSTAADAKGLLAAAIRDDDPVIYYEPKRIYRAFKEEVPDGEHATPLGQARVVREGNDVTVVSWGATLRLAAQPAAEQAAAQGVSCDVIDPRTLKPLDEKTILDSVKKTGRLVVVTEEPRMAGVAAELMALANEKAFDYLKAPPARVTSFDVPTPLAKMEDYYYPTPERALDGILRSAKYGT